MKENERAETLVPDKVVFKEWWSCTGDHSWSYEHIFEEAFFFKDMNTLEVTKCTLNDIAIYHIWRYQCNILYKDDKKITLVVLS
jgi:hypothetical protein